MMPNSQGTVLLPSHLLERGGVPFHKYCQEVWNTQVAPEVDYNELLRIYREQYKAQYGVEIKTDDAPAVFPPEVFEGFEYGNKVRMEKAFIGFVNTAFGNYIDGFKTRRLLYCVNSKGEHLYLPLKHRFTRAYTKKVKSRMDSLNAQFSKGSTVLLTLTLDPKKWDSKLDMWTNIKKELNRFMTSLRNHFKQDNKERVKRGLSPREFPPYLATVQAHAGEKNRKGDKSESYGNPHIHIVFFNAARLLDWREIRDAWGLGHIYINRTPDGKKIRNPVSYVTRYITRTFTKTTDENRLTQALVWFFGVRSYTNSRGLVTPLSLSSGEFEALCLVIVSDVNIPFELIHSRVTKYVNTFLSHCIPP